MLHLLPRTMLLFTPALSHLRIGAAAAVLSCASLPNNRYCMHCPADGGQPAACVANGGAKCTTTYQVRLQPCLRSLHSHVVCACLESQRAERHAWDNAARRVRWVERGDPTSPPAPCRALL